jgi:Ser/Thr protein kinase RdoA (MazF antagonist)
VDDVRRVLRRIHPDAEPTLTPAARGNRKRTVVVVFGDRPDLVVQITPDPATALTEAAVLTALADRVPTPTVRALGTLEGGGYLVTDRAAGDDLHDLFAGLPDDGRIAVAREFGRVLGAVHDQWAFRDAGPLSAVPDGDLTVAEPTPPEEWLRDYARAGIEALPDAFDDLRPALAAAVGDAGPAADGDLVRLFPWDLRPGNALYDDGVTAIVDWEAPLAAPPGVAVAKLEHLVARWYVADADEQAALRAALQAGYEEYRPYPAVSRAERVAAVVTAAVDSAGVVTRPRYPELTGDDAVAVHRGWFEDALGR